MKSLLNQFKELDFSQLLKVNGGYSGSSGGGSSSGNSHASCSFGGSSGASVTVSRGYSSSSSGSGGGHCNLATVTVKGTPSSATKSYAVNCANSYSQQQPQLIKWIYPAVGSKDSFPSISSMKRVM